MGKALGLEVHFATIAGYESTAEILASNVADDLDTFETLDTFVVCQGYGEEEFIILSSVEGGCHEVHIQFLSHHRCLIIDWDAVFVDATSRMAVMAYVEELGRQTVADIDHRGRFSLEICHTLAAEATPGTHARNLYEKAVAIMKERGLEPYFMGHRQHAGFVGHGVGIEVNELPVLAPRSKAVLAEGNVIAIEPKFVIPHFGAIGIENTYVVTPDGLECLTNAPEEIIPLT